MIATFIGLATSLVTLFGILLPVWHWLSMGWKEAEQKGTNPYVTGLFTLFVGFLIGFTIVGSFLAFVGVIGFPGRVYNCYFFSGGDVELCKKTYAEEWKKAEENKIAPEQLEKQIPSNAILE